jgi:hypothetical protein
MAAITFFVFFGCGSPNIRWIDYEGAQQVAAGLDALSAADFRYTQLAFLGYPARQYVMLALPSVLGGRNMLSLQFGFDFIFAVSALAMYTGLNEYFIKYKPHLAQYSSIITLMTLTSPVIADLTRICEQSLLPSAFTMMGLGCFLMYIRKANVTSVIGIAFSGVTLAAVYTPGFASAFLLIAVLIKHMFCRDMETRIPENAKLGEGAVLDFSLALLTGITLFCSLKLISEGNAISGDSTTLEFLISAIKQILTENPYGIFRMLTPVVLLFAVLALAGVFGISDLQLILWACSTIAASLIMKGYNTNSIVSVHRGSVTVPVLAGIVGFRYFDCVHSYLKNKTLNRLLSYGFCLFIMFIVSLNIASPQFMPRIWSSAPQKIQTRIALESQDMLNNPEFNKSAPPVLVYFTEDGVRANPYEHLKYINPSMRALTSDHGVIEEPYSIENGAIIYAWESAVLPDEYKTMNGFETLNWLIDGKAIRIRRLLISPR